MLLGDEAGAPGTKGGAKIIAGSVGGGKLAICTGCAGIGGEDACVSPGEGGPARLRGLNGNASELVGSGASGENGRGGLSRLIGGSGYNRGWAATGCSARPTLLQVKYQELSVLFSCIMYAMLTCCLWRMSLVRKLRESSRLLTYELAISGAR